MIACIYIKIKELHVTENHGICFFGGWLKSLFLCETRSLCTMTPHLSEGSPVVFP